MSETIVNLQYYARFLRTGKAEYAVKAVNYPKEKSEWTEEEEKQAVDMCRNQRKGKIALMRWRRNKKDVRANLAFVILYREGQIIPSDLFEAVAKNIEKLIDNYEDKQKPFNSDDEYKSQYSELQRAIDKRSNSTTTVKVFEKYAKEWNVQNTETKEPCEVLRERYKKWKKREIQELNKRLENPSTRQRERIDIKNRLDKLQKLKGKK